MGRSTADLGSLPVLAHLEGALRVAEAAFRPELVEAVRLLAEQAAWTQTAGYLERPPGLHFLDRYAHTTLAGPADGFGSSPDAGSSDAAVGLLILEPDVLYPAHRHPAEEVYLPLTSARWLDHETGEYADRPVGELRHHRPGQPHGMLTTTQPLLAVYVWAGDVVTPAQFC